MNNIKFRVWNTILKKFKTIPKEFNRCAHFCFLTENNSFSLNSNKNFIIQRYTGLKDKKGQEIYEGDIVEFKYYVGDFAREFMSKKETKKNDALLNKNMVCEVKWQEMFAGFALLSGNEKSTHISFPMTYLRNAKLIGNIFENV